jgi:hypothetical protein
MNKSIELHIAERILLVGIFNQVKGDIETLSSVLEDVKEVTINEKEKKEINFREVKDEKGTVISFAWDKSDPKKITLSEKTVIFVNKFIDERSKNEELTVADAPLLELIKKLK